VTRPDATLANWQDPGINEWAFGHVRELIPTERIGRGAGPASLLVSGDAIDLDGVVVNVGEKRQSAAAVVEASNTDALMMVHEGRIRVEQYGATMAPDRTHILMSVSKSVTSTLAGILISEGLLRSSDGVTRHVPELVGTGFDGCTVQDLLDFRAGIAFSEDYADMDADVRIYEQVAGHRPRTKPDLPSTLYDYMPGLASKGHHGGAFDYQSILTDLLAWVLECAAGATFAELVSSRIWSRIGAEYDAEVTVDPAGCALADGGICATLRDVARFGLAHLERGVVADRQVVPRAWVLECTRRDGELVDAYQRGSAGRPDRFAMYHNNWWVLDADRGISAGLGIYGQFLYVDRSRDCVIVKFSSWPTALDLRLADLHFALADALCSRAEETARGT
jgi:CubicO group peptidase (beta-lactamase class C family)